MNDTAVATNGPISTCANCDAPLAEGQHFCGACGQRTVRARLTMRDIGHDFLHAITHVDHSILSLVKALLLRPGVVAREFVEGRRKKYFGPFAFLVIMVGLASFMFVVTGVKWAESDGQTGIVDFLQRHVNVLMLLSMPMLALGCWLLFWNERLYFAEHLVLVAYTSGFKILCLAVIALPVAMFAKIGFADVRFFSIFQSLAVLYFAFAAAQFYRGRWAWVVVRAIIASVAGAVLTMGLLSALLTAYVQLTSSLRPADVAPTRERRMSGFQLAQINVARLKAPLDSPELKDFVDNLDRINALAESSEGFVWRLKGEGNDATALRPFGDDIIVNMSVWRDVASLKAFVYQSGHTQIMRRRREWFSRMDIYMVLWWVPAGHEPSTAEAASRLEHLRQHGPTPAAFTFGEAFSAPDASQPGQPFSFKDACPA